MWIRMIVVLASLALVYSKPKPQSVQQNSQLEVLRTVLTSLSEQDEDVANSVKKYIQEFDRGSGSERELNGDDTDVSNGVYLQKKLQEIDRGSGFERHRPRPLARDGTDVGKISNGINLQKKLQEFDRGSGSERDLNGDGTDVSNGLNLQKNLQEFGRANNEGRSFYSSWNDSGSGDVQKNLQEFGLAKNEERSYYSSVNERNTGSGDEISDLRRLVLMLAEKQEDGDQNTTPETDNSIERWITERIAERTELDQDITDLDPANLAETITTLVTELVDNLQAKNYTDCLMAVKTLRIIKSELTDNLLKNVRSSLLAHVAHIVLSTQPDLAILNKLRKQLPETLEFMTEAIFATVKSARDTISENLDLKLLEGRKSSESSSTESRSTESRSTESEESVSPTPDTEPNSAETTIGPLPTKTGKEFVSSLLQRLFDVVRVVRRNVDKEMAADVCGNLLDTAFTPLRTLVKTTTHLDLVNIVESSTTLTEEVKTLLISAIQEDRAVLKEAQDFLKGLTEALSSTTNTNTAGERLSFIVERMIKRIQLKVKIMNLVTHLKDGVTTTEDQQSLTEQQWENVIEELLLKLTENLAPECKQKKLQSVVKGLILQKRFEIMGRKEELSPYLANIANVMKTALGESAMTRKTTEILRRYIANYLFQKIENTLSFGNDRAEVTVVTIAHLLNKKQSPGEGSTESRDSSSMEANRPFMLRPIVGTLVVALRPGENCVKTIGEEIDDYTFLVDSLANFQPVDEENLINALCDNDEVNNICSDTVLQKLIPKVVDLLQELSTVVGLPDPDLSVADFRIPFIAKHLADLINRKLQDD